MRCFPGNISPARMMTRTRNAPPPNPMIKRETSSSSRLCALRTQPVAPAEYNPMLNNKWRLVPMTRVIQAPTAREQRKPTLYRVTTQLMTSELAPTLPCMSGSTTLMESRFEISTAATSPTLSRMAIRRRYDRPDRMLFRNCCSSSSHRSAVGEIFGARKPITFLDGQRV